MLSTFCRVNSNQGPVDAVADLTVRPRNHRLRTPLHVAARNGYEEVVDSLQEKGASKDRVLARTVCVGLYLRRMERRHLGRGKTLGCVLTNGHVTYIDVLSLCPFGFRMPWRFGGVPSQFRSTRTNQGFKSPPIQTTTAYLTDP